MLSWRTADQTICKKRNGVNRTLCKVRNVMAVNVGADWLMNAMAL